jgi:hypothetical protein
MANPLLRVTTPPGDHVDHGVVGGVSGLKHSGWSGVSRLDSPLLPLSRQHGLGASIARTTPILPFRKLSCWYLSRAHRRVAARR